MTPNAASSATATPERARTPTADRSAPAEHEDGVTGTESRLRTYNLVMGLVHAAQVAAILVLANDFALPVTATFLDGPPGGGPPELDTLFDLRFGPAIAAFLGLSAFFHLLIASPLGFGPYVRELRARRNRFRWVEYSLSASLMIVLIAMVTGISDVAALLALFGVNASMILFGWLMETGSDPEGEVSWTPFTMGCLAGAVPWIAIGIYLVSPGSQADPPGFVYGIFVTLFILFNSFALNQWLQYRRIGPWRRYTFGEAGYVALSLVAKSALAWQVFANTLVS